MGLRKERKVNGLFTIDFAAKQLFEFFQISGIAHDKKYRKTPKKKNVCIKSFNFLSDLEKPEICLIFSSHQNLVRKKKTMI